MPSLGNVVQTFLRLADEARKIAHPEQGPTVDIKDHRVAPSWPAAQQWYAGAVAEVQTLVAPTVVDGFQRACADVLQLTQAINAPARSASAEALCLDGADYLERTAKTLTAAQVLPDPVPAPQPKTKSAPVAAK